MVLKDTILTMIIIASLFLLWFMADRKPEIVYREMEIPELNCANGHQVYLPGEDWVWGCAAAVVVGDSLRFDSTNGDCYLVVDTGEVFMDGFHCVD
jgi:hypothetical protein